MTKQQSDIEASPLNREHQDRVLCLKQEISTIEDTLDRKGYVLYQAQAGSSTVPTWVNLPPPRRSQPAVRHGYVQNNNYHYSNNEYYTREVLPRTPSFPSDSLQQVVLSPTGVEGLIIQESISLVEGRIREFREMQDVASDLADWVLLLSS